MVLAILTNCLGSCSGSLNFNVLKKGEMPTDPVSRTIPHFIVLCFIYNGKRRRNRQKGKGKNAIWTLYDSIRIKDTWKSKKRLFSVENGKEGKRQYGIYWIKARVLINWISDRRVFQVLFN